MITSVMYHYIRPVEVSELRYLSVEDFEKQLDWLQGSIGNFLTGEDWEEAKLGKPSSGVLLTFDDGLKDHIDFVLPILQRRNIFGIFFVNTSPFVTKRMLAVHLTHKLLSLGKSNEILQFFHQVLPESIWSKLNSGVASSAYTKHIDSNVNVTIKKIINYLFTDFNLAEVLEMTSERFLSSSLSELTSAWYLSESDVRFISDAGMKIGSHASTHRLLSLLQKEEIYVELSESKYLLESLIEKQVDEFCYPYGGPHSYNQTVKDYLAQLNFSVAHDVSPREIGPLDFQNKFSLPRFNCNELPFGIAHSLKNQ
jgi:peptidoglycan/xylan/chitin deacetylase (PgdA/CDA1 family)